MADARAASSSSLRVSVEVQTDCKSQVKAEADSWAARKAYLVTCQVALSSASALLVASRLAIKGAQI
jgi:hypothetical protein